MTASSSEDVTATLMYAGEIAGRARFDIMEPNRTNLAFVPVEATIHDVRPRRDALTVDGAGFAFMKHQSTAIEDPALFEANMVRDLQPGGASTLYNEEVAEFLQREMGADLVFPQLGGLLFRTSTRAARKSWALPANFVHLDFTADSARKFLDWSAEAEGLELKPFRRFAVYQTWRAVSPGPQDSTLAICDGGSVPPSDGVVFDAVVADQSEPGGMFESRICRPGSGHRWYYLPNMEPDDLLVFKGFDSDVPDAMNAMHTAFDNPLAGPDAVPRMSIEARFIALFN